MPNLFDAFISYGRADSKAFATKLHTRLMEQGFNLWFDQNDIPLAVNFQNQIDDGIEKTHNFLFIIAPHSVNSEYCLKEINLAVKLNKRIIPLLHVEEIDKATWQQRTPQGTDADWEQFQMAGKHSSHFNMHPVISKINWVLFREGIDDFDKSFAGLVSAMHNHADYVAQHTQILVQALEWERHRKRPHYLLIAEERQKAESWLKVRFKDEQPPCEPSDLHCEFISESSKNANNMMTQVFLSYADTDTDQAFMEQLQKTLMRESFTVWANKTDIDTGAEFQAEINKGIEEADNFVYLVSPDSVVSKYCEQELEHATALNKRIILLLIADTNLAHLPLEIRALPFIDFIEHQDEEQYRLSTNKLLKELNQDAPYYQQHKILLVKALKWQAQNRNSSILLRGYNLQHFEAWLKGAQQHTAHSPLPLQEEFIRESNQQPANLSLEVFISYSRTDSDFARKLNDALQMQGKTTWFDQESIAAGEDFQQEIHQGIESCDNFLFILSPSSVNSSYCADEVEYAQRLEKRFVTVLHRSVNETEIHPMLRRIQWIDFSQPEEDFHLNFSELIRTLDIDRDYVRNHSKWSQRSKEWAQKDKSTDLLLRGNEFAVAENWLQEAKQQQKEPPPTHLQQEFIADSRQAIQATKQQERRWEIALRALLGLVSVALVIAGVLGIAVYFQYQQAVINEIKSTITSSEALLASNNRLDALIKAIQAKKKLQKLGGTHTDIQRQADFALQHAVYGIIEYNRLSGRHRAEIWQVVFSHDNQMIATASWDNTIKLWQPDGTILNTFEGHESSVNGIAFSPISHQIASGSWDKTVKLWQLDGKLLKTFRGHSKKVNDVSFSPNGQIIASASDDQNIIFWKTDDYSSLMTLKAHSKPVNSVIFSPDGSIVASASEDTTIKLWQLDGTLLNTLKGHTQSVNRIAFSPDGSIIASASDDKTIRLWQQSDGIWTNTKILSGHSDGVLAVAFRAKDSMIASASRDRTVKLWQPNGNLLTTLKGHRNGIWGVAFSPDSSMLASGGWDNTVKLWNLEGRLTTLRGHSEAIWTVAFSPDGNQIVTGSEDHTLKLWQADGTLLKTIPAHSDAVWDVAFSPDGSIIASASADQRIKLWQAKDGTLLKNLRGHKGTVWDVVFSPDGSKIASASDDHTIKLWQSDDGTLLKTFQGHEGVVNALSFSPDGSQIVSASEDKTVKLWKLDGTVIKTFEGHKAGVWAVAFSPDGSMIASGGGEHIIRLWNPVGTLLKQFTGHSNGIWDISFSSDSTMLASASIDNTVKLWQRDGTLLGTFKGHSNTVSDVSFSPDNETIASASEDKTVILWDLKRVQDSDYLQEYACDWVHDYLQTNVEVGEEDWNLCEDTWSFE